MVEFNFDGFKLDHNANCSGTSFHMVEVTVNPKLLIEGLGASGTSYDDYKSSKEWTFTRGQDVFTLYDWKETSNYDEGLPSPARFWAQNKVTLHIGHMRETIADAKLLKTLLESLYGKGL